MNANYSRLMKEARAVVGRVMGITAAPMTDKRMLGNEIQLEYALGRAFVLNFRGVANREYEDGLELVCTRFVAMLGPEHAPKMGWSNWLMGKDIFEPAASRFGFVILGEQNISKLFQ